MKRMRTNCAPPTAKRTLLLSSYVSQSLPQSWKPKVHHHLPKASPPTEAPHHPNHSSTAPFPSQQADIPGALPVSASALPTCRYVPRTRPGPGAGHCITLQRGGFLGWLGAGTGRGTKSVAKAKAWGWNAVMWVNAVEGDIDARGGVLVEGGGFAFALGRTGVIGA